MRFLLIGLVFMFATSCKQPSFDDIKNNPLNQDDLAKLTPEQLLALAKDRLAKAQATTTKIVEAGKAPNAPISALDPVKQEVNEQLGDVEVIRNELNNQTGDIADEAKKVNQDADEVVAVNEAITLKSAADLAASTQEHKKSFLTVLKELVGLQDAIEEPEQEVCIIEPTPEDAAKKEALANVLIDNAVIEGDTTQEALAKPLKSAGFMEYLSKTFAYVSGCYSVDQDVEIEEEAVANLAVPEPNDRWTRVVEHVKSILDSEEKRNEHSNTFLVYKWVTKDQVTKIFALADAFANSSQDNYQTILASLTGTGAPTKENLISSIAHLTPYNTDERLTTKLKGGVGEAKYNALKAAIDKAYTN